MTRGIRAELKVPAAVGCPLARVSVPGDVKSYSVSKSVDPTVPEHVTEEFAVEPDESDVEVEGVDLTTSFDDGSASIYRFERTAGQNCPCECIERHGYPVVDVRGEHGTLYVVFHVPDQDALRDVISTMGEHHPQVEVRRLLQSRPENDGVESLVFFDTSSFTDRQQEVLETAHRLGYFDHPKGANAGEVASELGITTATFVEHLSAAQRKLFDSIVDTDAA
jgi:predicted DNA binding protein